MASGKTDLARAGTMQMTAKAGKAYLDKNLTDWKKPFLMTQFDDENGAEESSDSDAKSPPPKPKMAKHSTMKGTAKAASHFLGAGGPDEDVFTRTQQKKLEEIKAEKPAAKKARMSKATTMAATAKEAKSLLAGEKLADTRQETKAKKGRPSLKKASTMAQAVDEAKVIYGSDVSTSGGRQLRKRKAAAASPKPAKMKRAGTMQKTAKEGKAYLKRGKKGKKGKKN